MDGNLASVISLTRHLSVSVVLIVPQTDGRTDGNLASVISLARHLSVSVVLLVPGVEGFKRRLGDKFTRHFTRISRVLNLNISGNPVPRVLDIFIIHGVFSCQL